MATLNPPYESAESARSAPRGAALTVLRHAAVWQALAAVGLMLVCVGFGVDAYRHKHGAGLDELIGGGSPGMMIVLVGLGLTLLGTLATFSILMLADATEQQVLRRGALVLAVWVVACSTAAASVVYVANSGLAFTHSGHGGTDGHSAEEHAHSAQPVAADDEPAEDDHAAGHAGGEHDRGKHATFTQLMDLSEDDLLPMFPEGSVAAAELPALRDQVAAVRRVADRFPTTGAASGGGYVNITADVEAMGHHWINYQYVEDGVFDPAKPEGLLFSKIDGGEPRLVGVWFLQWPGNGGATQETPPEGFAGDLDVWHGHKGICLTQDTASEGGNAASCAASGGRYIDDARWMMHVWVAPEASENPNGFFAYLNDDLAAKQVAPAPLEQFGEF